MYIEALSMLKVVLTATIIILFKIFKEVISQLRLTMMPLESFKEDSAF